MYGITLDNPKNICNECVTLMKKLGDICSPPEQDEFPPPPPPINNYGTYIGWKGYTNTTGFKPSWLKNAMTIFYVKLTMIGF